MIWILKEYEEDKEKFVVVRLKVTCCDETIVFMKLSEETYFDTRHCEPCTFQWNLLILQAYKNKEMMGRQNPPC